MSKPQKSVVTVNSRDNFRSIKLGEVSYDSAPTTPQHRDNFVRNVGNGGVGGLGTPRNRVERGGSVDGDSSLRAESVEGLTVYDEVQMMRRQIAKLNHRLMAVELENQQQQQREMVRTFIQKLIFLELSLPLLGR